uniref:Bromodomain associated domain-containing protein n=1 Tax=Parascaris univalens TaxID=6257 RepID=A0A915A551_PARUN
MGEEYAREQMRRAAARVALNTGFARAGTRAFSVLADVMQKYLQQMWLRAKMVAEHAGRLQPNFLDANVVLNDMHVSLEEMGEYMRQVGPFGPERKVPKFPVKLASSVDSRGVALVERHGRDAG